MKSLGLQNRKQPNELKAEFWIVNLELGVSNFEIQYISSHGISILIWPSNKVTILYAKFKKKLVKMLCQNCQIAVLLQETVKKVPTKKLVWRIGDI